MLPLLLRERSDERALKLLAAVDVAQANVCGRTFLVK